MVVVLMAGLETSAGRGPGRSGWRRASMCSGGECVEVATEDDGVQLRNSADPASRLRISRGEWHAFVVGVKAGEFDDLE